MKDRYKLGVVLFPTFFATVRGYQSGYGFCDLYYIVVYHA